MVLQLVGWARDKKSSPQKRKRACYEMLHNSSDLADCFENGNELPDCIRGGDFFE